MANELPVGGVTIDQVQPQYRQWFIDAARQYNVPLTFLLNIYGAESSLGTNISNTRVARGIMQIGDTTAQRYGINANDPQSSIFGAARLFGQYIDKYRDPYLAAMAYNWGEGDPNNPSPVKGLLAYQTRGWGAVPEETLRYVDNVMRGVGPSPVGLRDEIARRLYGMPEAGDRIFDVPLPSREELNQLRPTELDLAPPGAFSPTPDFQQGLPFAPTRQTTNLAEWLNDPAGGAGLPSEVRDLAFGPRAFTNRDVPWVQPWMIDESLGNVLQQYGYMPSNLMFNEFNGTWDVAQQNPLWVQSQGPWGSIAVDRWREQNADNPAAAGQMWYTEQLKFPNVEGAHPVPPGQGEEIMQRLQMGPGAFIGRDVPWAQSGVISQSFGDLLKSQGLMPSNLAYHPDTQNWHVAQQAPLWINSEGPWGTRAVDYWRDAATLPVAEGMKGYLDQLKFPDIDQPAATREQLTPYFGGELSPSYYGIPNTYNAPPAGVLPGNFPHGPASASQYYGILGLGNGQLFQGMGDIADMSTYGHQPFDYTQWLPGPSTHQPPGGNIGSQVADYNQGYRRTFGYPGLPPPGTYPTLLPPEGTYGDQPGPATHVIPGPFGSSPVQDYGQPNVYQQIANTTAYNTALNNQVISGGSIGPGGVPLAIGNTGGILTYNMGPGGIPLALGY